MSRKKHLLGYVIMGIWLVLSSCEPMAADDNGGEIKEEKEKTLDIKNKPVLVNTSLNCENGTSLNYQNFGKSFITKYCISCHNESIKGDARLGVPETMNFESLAQIQVWRTKILESTIKKRTMPVNNIISETNLNLFQEWMECGSP